MILNPVDLIGTRFNDSPFIYKSAQYNQIYRSNGTKPHGSVFLLGTKKRALKNRYITRTYRFSEDGDSLGFS